MKRVRAHVEVPCQRWLFMAPPVDLFNIFNRDPCVDQSTHVSKLDPVISISSRNLSRVSISVLLLYRSWTYQILSIWDDLSKESGALASHPHSLRLAQKKPGNESRDFWRAHDIPVVPWLCSEHSDGPNSQHLGQLYCQRLFRIKIMGPWRLKALRPQTTC